jgi:pyruvate dehydrogenase E2 component (dihydrolipoamide acetyltransferase)
MATPVEVPKLGNSVEECIIGRWVKRVGDALAAGDVVVEIETDKTTFEVTAPVGGKLLATFFEEGAVVPVFTNFFVVGDAGEDADAFRPQAAGAVATATAGAVVPAPAAVSGAVVPAAVAAIGTVARRGDAGEDADASRAAPTATAVAAGPAAVAAGPAAAAVGTAAHVGDTGGNADASRAAPAAAAVAAVSTVAHRGDAGGNAEASRAAPTVAAGLVAASVSTAARRGDAGGNAEASRAAPTVAAGLVAATVSTAARRGDAGGNAEASRAAPTTAAGPVGPVAATPGSTAAHVGDTGGNADASRAAPTVAAGLVATTVSTAARRGDTGGNAEASRAATAVGTAARTGDAGGNAEASRAAPTAAAVAAGPVAATVSTAARRGDAGGNAEASRAATTVSTAARMSPRARRFAEVHDFHPAAAIGSGPSGRILEEDLRKLFEARPKSAPRSRLRETIARRMRESLATTAQYTMNASADAAGLLMLRARIKASVGAADININHLVTFCTIRALREVPSLNAEFIEGRIQEHDAVHLGFACDTPKGLMVPVVRDAQALSLADLAARMKDLTARAVAGTIAVDDLAGGTFTMSNLGNLGIEWFTPLLNPPQVAILGVNAIQLKPVRKDGRVEFIDAIGFSLTCDHQAIDGAPGARFLQVLRAKIEGVEAECQNRF